MASEQDQLFIALVMNGVQDYAQSKATVGKTITPEEATLFAKNLVVCVQAVMSEGVMLTPCSSTHPLVGPPPRA